ncbi:MAG: putative glycoside hydrolase [Oscillospiraceae bacterium]|nr:putative glycoside hydrolase [Oscillospiraceae bacterium]
MGQYYKPHRGRSRFQTFLRVFLIILIVVLLLAIAAFLYLKRYMVYGADGSAHLELPVGVQESVSPSPVLQSPSVVIEPSPSPSPSPSVSSGEPTYAKLYAPSELTKSAVSRAVTAKENAVVIDVKTINGKLAYSSDQELAPKTSASGTDLKTILADLKEQGLYCAARISCFRDNTLSKTDFSYSLVTSENSRWLDSDRYGWINPYSQDVQDYITGIAKELAQMGFNEIILDHCGFPDSGRISRIVYGSDAGIPFSQTIEHFCRQTKEAVSPYNVALSVVTDKTTLQDGENKETGQTREMLQNYADRVYVSAAASQRDTLAQDISGGTAGEQNAEWKLVSILSSSPSEKSFSYMVK